MECLCRPSATSNFVEIQHWAYSTRKIDIQDLATTYFLLMAAAVQMESQLQRDMKILHYNKILVVLFLFRFTVRQVPTSRRFYISRISLSGHGNVYDKTMYFCHWVPLPSHELWLQSRYSKIHVTSFLFHICFWSTLDTFDYTIGIK